MLNKFTIRERVLPHIQDLGYIKEENDYLLANWSAIIDLQSQTKQLLKY